MTDRTQWQLSQLDALRGIAILGVLLVHTAYGPPESLLTLSPVAAAVISAGQRGVQLFYIVSAFTLAMSFEKRSAEPGALRNYAIRRFFRVAPLFYVAMLLTRLLERPWSGNRTAHVLAATFTNGLHPVYIGQGAIGGWSLADEALFYVCLPFLVHRIRSLRSATVALLMSCALSRLMVLLLSMLFPALKPYWALGSMVSEFPVFVSGLFLYHLWKAVGDRTRDVFTICKYVLIAGVLLFATVLPVNDHGLLPETLALGMIVFATLLHPSPLLVNRLTIYLGKISFSLYLMHFYFYLWLERRRAHFFPWMSHDLLAFTTFITGTIVMIPVATATWYLIERPGMECGSRLIARLAGGFRFRTTIPPLTAQADAAEAQF